MKDNKEVVQNEQLKKQIDNLKKHSDKLLYLLNSLLNIVINNIKISNGNFEAIKNRLNCGIQ